MAVCSITRSKVKVKIVQYRQFERELEFFFMPSKLSEFRRFNGATVMITNFTIQESMDGHTNAIKPEIFRPISRGEHVGHYIYIVRFNK